MFRWTIARCATILILLGLTRPLCAQFDLDINLVSTGFNATQQAELNASLAEAEALWEGVITGYQPGISLTTVSITVQSGSSFADAQVIGTTNQGGFRLSTSGRVRINPGVIDAFASWNGVPGPPDPNVAFLGLNYVDDVLAHEIGHVLGIGTQWVFNGVYATNTFQYTGQFGLAAYRQEFDPNAAFVPVENAGGLGTPNTHWDQLMRSSSQEGNPSDPWSLDPRVGVTDPLGRDRASELMTGALDPDYGEPFLSLTTIRSLNDIGFTTVPEPSSLLLLAMSVVLATFRRRGHMIKRL